MRFSDWSSGVCSSDRGVAGDAGGIDQDVERAVRGDDVFDQPAAGVEIGDVAGGEMDVEAGGFPAERLDAFVAVAQVDGDDGAALRRQLPADRGAETADTAGDGSAALVQRGSPVTSFLSALGGVLFLAPGGRRGRLGGARTRGGGG